MRLRAFVLSAVLLAIAWSAFGQKVDLRNDRVAMTVLSGPWRFHAGDDPAWASPDFDDSGWSLIYADKGWSQQGYAGYGGVAWYRLEVSSPPRPGPLALYIPTVNVSCQVFANGRMIGQFGGLPPQPKWVTSGRLMFPIPEEIASSGRLLLAIRVWEPESYAGKLASYAGGLPGGLVPAPRIGDIKALEQWRNLEGREVYWQNSASVIELIANIIGALASLGMFLLRRKEREFLWFGLLLVNWSIYHVVMLYAAFQPMPYYLEQILRATATTLGALISMEFYATFLRQPRGLPYVLGDCFALVMFCGFVTGFLYPTALGWSVFGFAMTGFTVCVAILIYRAWKEGSRDAGILLIPIAWSLVELFLQMLTAVPDFSHQAWAQAFRTYSIFGLTWPFPYWIPSLRGDVTDLLILIILILRFARSRSDEERLESELEAARTVQKVLIPNEFPVIPGFHVEAVYKPAGEVGGDFFQVVGVPNGSALVVVGDVSGKGMPAAMTVSLLVGTFRTLAHYTRNPGEILRAMNQRMLARSSGGFTTCIVLCVDPDGSVTAANAGHLPPYLEKRELEIENDLPLGLDAESNYAESRFRLKPGDQLTLITDGVTEARNAAGELFGFENALAISSQSAEAIAEKALRFGQFDDVTVVKLTWQPALLSPSASLMFSGEPASY